VTLAALHFPQIGELVEWPDFLFKGKPYSFNKIALLSLVSSAIVLALFFAAGRRAELVPRGVQNAMEMVVEFIRDQVVLQTMGPSGLAWVPFLTAMFMFLLVANTWEIIPLMQMPVTGRMAVPFVLAVLVWVIFNVMGIKEQGIGPYLKNSLFPPGVPKFLLPLVALIEVVSIFLVRPFSLAVRLFANMLAGHLLLVTFSVLAAALFTKSIMVVLLPLPAAMLILLWGFELLVGLLQAYIFTILTAVYISDATQPEH
jgi:F-type H+-transporting ATPase subunit a